MYGAGVGAWPEEDHTLEAPSAAEAALRVGVAGGDGTAAVPPPLSTEVGKYWSAHAYTSPYILSRNARSGMRLAAQGVRGTIGMAARHWLNRTHQNRHTRLDAT